MSALLRAEGLTKRFGDVTALDGVSFEAQPGEIHCLFGQNGAGKSTLSRCLYGYVQPDSGTIHHRDIEIRLHSPADAIRLGIGMIHQHFMLVDRLTVLENVVIGTRHAGFFLDLGSARKKFRQLCEAHGVDLSPDAVVEHLSVGQQQWVEIIKALFLDCEILILDEPTAVLTPQESARLLAALEAMRAAGLAIILISHKLKEVMRSDRVTVLRGGRVAASLRTQMTTPQELSRLMVGRDVTFAYERDHPPTGEAILEVRDLCVRGDRGERALSDVSFQVHGREILGIAGIAGNGQKELFEALVRVRAIESGSIRLHGRSVTTASTRGLMSVGVGHIPEDRYRQGLIGSFDIAENLILGQQHAGAFRAGPFLDRAAIAAFARSKMAEYTIAAPATSTRADQLSGGNAQRVILAREFERSSSLLLANQPTRGLDVGLIDYVYRKLLAKRREGFAILLALEELEDLMALSDRIAVISKGRIVRIIEPTRTSIDEIGLLMAGGSQLGELRHAD